MSVGVQGEGKEAVAHVSAQLTHHRLAICGQCPYCGVVNSAFENEVCVDQYRGW